MPRGEAGATPPPPAARSPCPARPCAASRRCGSQLLGPWQSGRGSQPRAPGGGRATPSPAPARRSHGRSSRRLLTGRSTGCSARSWWGRVAGARTVRGAATGGAGARGPTGLGTGCACLSAARLPHRLVGGGAGRRGGETPPSSRPGERRGPLFLPPPSPQPPPPCAPAPSAPAPWGKEMRSRGPAKAGSGVGWGPLGRRGESCLSH